MVSCTSHNVTQIVGAVTCRQAVPLTVALLNVSNPNLNAVDTLSRLSHDTDIQVAQNAVLALGKHTFYLTFLHWESQQSWSDASSMNNSLSSTICHRKYLSYPHPKF